MDIAESVRSMAVKAKDAARRMRALSSGEKNALLLRVADALEASREAISAANAADAAAAEAAGLSPAMVDRLRLTDARFAAMVEGVRHVASLPDPVGETVWTRERPSGITIRKVREPFGVIAVVFESRPNVLVDTAALCLKTGNAIVLRGGKEAIRSNTALARAVKSALRPDVAEAVQFVETTDHAIVTELVRAVGLVDVAIPRGGERLIRAMCEAALIPVLKHYKGVCHIYVDAECDQEMALRILDNAKVQRPSACNAAECLLVNAEIAGEFLPKVLDWAERKGVLLHVDEAGDGADYVEWDREFLALEMNVGVVRDVKAAIAHINAKGSHHSDAIVTSDDARAAEFLRDVDSACVYRNASTRFTDGAEFGMGAEIGISTDKLHARGPMGLEELTTYKYVVTGDGVTRS